MKIENIWVFLAVFFTIIVVVVGQKSLRDRYLGRLAKALSKNDYELFDKYADGIAVKLLFDSFSIAYMKLNSAFLQDDKQIVDKAFKEFEYIDMSPKQKEDVYSKAFNYYMNSHDYERARIYVERIDREMSKMPIAKQCQMVYDIYALNSIEHIDALIEECDKTPVNQRGFIEMLISDSYKNKNDAKNAKKYKELSLAHFKALENDIKKGKVNGKKSAKR